MTGSNTPQLSDLFQLEKIEQGLFRGQSWDLGFKAIFGGQVLAQALNAAAQTVDEDRVCHSFHTYFLLPGDATKPVVYDVENVRDGRSFSARRVKAIQNGKNIFYMTASFQSEQVGMEHQYAVAPKNIPKPENLEPDIAQYENNVDTLPPKIRKALAYHKPIDIRSIPSEQYAKGEKNSPVRGIWLRINECLSDTLHLHHSALAYASDYHFLTTALKAHQINPNSKNLNIATIDHAMWFHRPFRFDEWLLFTIDSPFSGNARGLVKGQFFNVNGELIASAVQEGLLRVNGQS